MTQCMTSAVIVVAVSVGACFGSTQGTALLQDSMRPQQSTGAWEVADGILRPTDLSHAEAYCSDVGGAFFTARIWEDFTLTCEFMIPKGSTGAGGPTVYFRCSSPTEYNVVHLINYWNNISLMRARTGEYETELAHVMGPPLMLNEWQRLRIHAKGERITVSLDGKRILQARDTPRPGIIGLAARVREVRYRNVLVRGAAQPASAPWRAFPPTRSYFTVCEDSGNGGYEAFPGLARLKNGDLIAVFYSGWSHVSYPGDTQRPNGGRICMVRSTDDGKTWSRAKVVGDTPLDDRDPSVWEANDGTVYCTWPACDWSKYRAGQLDEWCYAFRARSTDNGRTWSEPEQLRIGRTRDWTVWTEPRLLSDGSWLMPIYKNHGYTCAAAIRSEDDGKTWGDPAFIDETNKSTDEPDIVELPGGRLLCVMRPGSEVHAWQSWSQDLGRTWSRPEPLDWYAHAPDLLLTSRGILLCAHRDPGTAAHYSFDYGKTWAGMVMIDSCGGAYPAMVELADGRVLIVYYTEGGKSDIRGQFLRVSHEGVRPAQD